MESFLIGAVVMTLFGGIIYVTQVVWPRYKRAQVDRYLDIMGDDTAGAVSVQVHTRTRRIGGETSRVRYTVATHALPDAWAGLRCRLAETRPRDEDDTLVFEEEREVQLLCCTVGDPTCRTALEDAALRDALRGFLTGEGRRTIGDGEVRLEHVDEQDAMTQLAMQTDVADLLRVLRQHP